MTAQVDENKRLARCRTLLALAAEKVNRLADDHPQRRALSHKLNVIKDNLRSQEREVER
jgi:hypothetical protein